ncbi:nucleotide-binding protein [Candidatus Woesearchaeota archaeon]|nr:nucleotide-binding protein [Candidatus Woesearchaeota archaeon]
MPVKVILDTNFLLIPGQFGVDIFSEIRRICDFSHEICILDRTVDELRGIIALQKGRDKAAASLALQLVKSENARILDSKTAIFKNVDKIILEIACREKVVVATQDKLLKSGLAKLKTRVIVLRQKKYLKLEE